MESNKFYAAILLAGVLAMIAIIASGMLVKPEELAKPAYPIEGVAEAPAGGGEAKPAEIEPVTPLLAKADPDRPRPMDDHAHDDEGDEPEQRPEHEHERATQRSSGLQRGEPGRKRVLGGHCGKFGLFCGGGFC